MRKFILVALVVLCIAMGGCTVIQEGIFNLLPQGTRERIIKKVAKDAAVKRYTPVAKAYFPETLKLAQGEPTNEWLEQLAPCMDFAARRTAGPTESISWEHEVPLKVVTAALDKITGQDIIVCSVATEMDVFIISGEFKKELISLIADLYKKDLLKKVLVFVLAKKLPGDAEKATSMATDMTYQIGQGLCMDGKLDDDPDCIAAAKIIPTLEAFASNVVAKTRNGSAVDSSAFAVEAAEAVGEQWTSGNQVTVLDDGEFSYARREAFRAKLGKDDDYTFVTWGIYDDATGAAEVKALCDGKRNGANVRAMFDGATLEKQGGDLAKRLKGCGVPVVAYQRKGARKLFSTHIKAAIRLSKVGPKTLMRAIVGGRNPGDKYYSAWLDFELDTCGPAVRDVYTKVAAIWNSAVTEDAKQGSGQLMAAVGRGHPAKCNGVWDVANASLMVLAQVPSDSGKTGIAYMRAKVLDGAIAAARAGKTVEYVMQNAYFIPLNPLPRQITDLIKAGGTVSLHTNSYESIDADGGQIIMPPIMISLLKIKEELETAGMGDRLHIYLQRNSAGPDAAAMDRQTTLHAKVECVAVDGKPLVCIEGSDNIHGRGVFLEHELDLATNTPALTEKIWASIWKRINSDADLVDKAADLDLKGKDFVAKMIAEYFFKQL